MTTVFASEQGPVRAVRDVSFDISAGETLALVGESGSGKSSIALSLMRLLPASGRMVAGTIALDGTELTSMSSTAFRRIRGRRIGIVFQDSMASLNPLLNVGRQIGETLETHLGLSAQAARRRAIELLAEVGVPDPAQRARQFPHQLSGGLRQRVAIAIALAPNPHVLIADEPTTALDVTLQAQVLDLLRREQQQRAMALLVISHNLGVVTSIADRIAIMYAGRIVEEGPVEAVFAAPRHPYTLGLLRSVPRLDRELAHRLPSIPGAPPTMTETVQGCPFRPRCSFARDECAQRDPPLTRVADARSVACWADLGVTT